MLNHFHFSLNATIISLHPSWDVRLQLISATRVCILQQPASYLRRDPSLSIQLSLKSSYKYDILLPLVMRLFKKFLCCQCDENHTITLLALLRLRHLAKYTGLIFRLGAKSICSFMFFNVSKDSWFTNTILAPAHQIMPVILDLAEQDATRASCVPFICLLTCKEWNKIPLEIRNSPNSLICNCYNCNITFPCSFIFFS